MPFICARAPGRNRRYVAVKCLQVLAAGGLCATCREPAVDHLGSLGLLPSAAGRPEMLAAIALANTLLPPNGSMLHDGCVDAKGMVAVYEMQADGLDTSTMAHVPESFPLARLVASAGTDGTPAESLRVTGRAPVSGGSVGAGAAP